MESRGTIASGAGTVYGFLDLLIPPEEAKAFLMVFAFSFLSFFCSSILGGMVDGSLEAKSLRPARLI